MKIYRFLQLLIFVILIALYVSQISADSLISPFNERDIYLTGETYRETFGSVASIKIENGLATVIVDNPDGTKRLVTEDPEVFDQANSDSKTDSDEKVEVARIVTGTVRVSTSLNVRTSPWGDIIGSLYEGNQIKIIDRVGAWYRIFHNGQICFVHSNYVDAPGAPAGQVPVVYPWQMDSYASGGEIVAAVAVGGMGAPLSPMPNRVSSEYGKRTHPVTGEVGKMHYGIDLPVPTGTKLVAMADGVITEVGYNSGAGRYIVVRQDNGLEIHYFHNQSSSVKQGQRVQAGQLIGYSDNTGCSTGPHLHLGVKQGGQWVNPRSVGIPLPPK